MSDDYKVIKPKEIEIDHVDRYDQLSKSSNVRSLRTNLINVRKNVSLVDAGLSKLGFRFGTIGGEFLCNNNKLLDLMGMPFSVDGRCRSDNNVGVTSFNGGPDYVGGYYDASRCSIKSFDHCPRIVGDEFDVSGNKITSLVGIHKNLLQCSVLNIDKNPIQEGGIGLILINDLRKVKFYNWTSTSGIAYCDQRAANSRDFEKALSIIKKYLRQKDKLLQCQDELLDAGLERFAKL